MAGDYQLLISSALGVPRTLVVNFLELAYRREVSAPGLLTVTLPPDHPAIGLLELDGQVQVQRRDVPQGIAWYQDFSGLCRSTGYATDSDGDERFTFLAPGDLHLLARRYNLWSAGTANRTSFEDMVAETLMTTLVRGNAGSEALAALGRVRDGTLAGVTIETDLARGPLLNRANAWKNLLSELQDLCSVAVADIDLVKTAAATWDFRYYPGQRGTDRTATVILSTDLGNMAEPAHARDRIEEKTVAVVAAQGQGALRQTAVRIGTGWTAQNDIEVFVDARNETTAAGLATAGDRALYDTRGPDTFTFTVVQTPSCLYGKHYFLGDLLTARYRDIQRTVKVQAAAISLAATGEETVEIEMRTL